MYTTAVRRLRNSNQQNYFCVEFAAKTFPASEYKKVVLHECAGEEDGEGGGFITMYNGRTKKIPSLFT
jgi:hypothetical protein